MYLRAHQSEKELDQSLYKLRSTQLVILQNIEQLGFTLLQLQDTAWQEPVPNARQDLGQSGLLSLPRHIQTQHLPGYNKNSLNAIRTWVTGWFCCVIISITAALSNLDFTADLVDNPYMCEMKPCCSALTSAVHLPHLRPQRVKRRTFHPSLCLQYLLFAELSALVNTWCENGPRQRRSILVQPLTRAEEQQQKLAKNICVSCQSLSVISFFSLLFFPPSFTQSSVFRISCLQAALCIQLNLRLWLSHKRGER